MSVFILKLIAIITMIIDHTGVFLFPGNMEFRIIGRISFVLFAFLIANGYKYSKNYQMYLIKLVGMAFICQIPDMLGIFNYYGNIFFVLSLGLITIKLLDNQTFGSYFTYIIILILSHLIPMDYGVYGVLLINFFYLVDRFKINIPIQIILFFLLQYLGVAIENFSLITYFSYMGLILTWFYNEQKGYSAKWLNIVFYWFYPVHLIIIIAIKELIR